MFNHIKISILGESLCAQLNSCDLVDAVVTEDSDAFCYGVKTVLRNFSVASSKALSVEKFNIDKIQDDLGLDRNRFVLMAVLLGCDFFPTGVSGVGKETVLQLFRAWKKEWNVLKVMEFWIRTEFQVLDGGCSFCCQDEEFGMHCRQCKVKWI